MEKLETKIRQEEKSSYEKKLSDFEWQLEGKEKEISAMNKTIETLQTRLDKETSKPNTRREEFENVAQENRYLKSQVTDSQTTLALLRSELAELKSQFVEQSDQLQKEQNRAEGCVQEYDNLTRQLQLLHEANQRLQDVNDELRGALETKKNSAPERKISSEVLRMSGVFPDPIVNHGLSSSLRSNTFPRSKSATPPLGSRHAEYHGADFNDNTFNEDSLFSEIHRASTPYKSDSIDEDDDEAYGTMSKSKKAQVQRQIQILEDTNKRLGSSNDELRVALKMMARSGSFRKPKKTSSGSRRPHSFHSDYSSLSSNRSSRSLSPKQKRLSNGDIGEATDESTTYDVEEEENVGTIVEESLKDLVQYSKESELAVDQSTDDCKIENTTDNQNNSLCENATEVPETLGAGLQKSSSNGDQVDRTDYDACVDLEDPSNERILNGKKVKTRSKSLEMFYIENFAHLDRDEGSMSDGIRHDQDFEEERLEDLLQNLVLEDDCCDIVTENDGTVDNGDKSNYDNTNSRDIAKNNSCNGSNEENKGLWEITKALNAFEVYKSQTSLNELSCIEEEGSNEGDSCSQEEREEEGLVGKESKTNALEERLVCANSKEDVQNRDKSNRNKHNDSRTEAQKGEKGRIEKKKDDQKDTDMDSLEDEEGSEDEFSSGNGSAEGDGLELEPLEQMKLDQRELEGNKNTVPKHQTFTENRLGKVKKRSPNESFEESKIDDQMSNKHGLVNGGGLDLDKGAQRGKVSKERELPEIRHQENGLEENGLEENRLQENGLQENGLGGEDSEEDDFDDEESEFDTDEEDKIRVRKGGDGSDKGKKNLSFNESLEYDDDESYDDSYDEESEYSSDEELSDSSTEQHQKDSTATMNSETIAELETQFKKITESKDEEKDTKSDLDDDDDEDGMDSTELAELVAMASDLTDVTDSESETGRSSSGNRTGEISTMTEMNGSPSYATPERMYKLVLAGDAAVGKSSFILRLCKNKFHSSLNATLGVDFQVKNLKVDSKTVALQLWDTAGQERFRSIAKSYFRKVDGVLLLYDVTCEASFVNIRDWMSTIEESSQKKVPIMLCGNKCDLRDEFLMEGKKVISTESGQRLAKHYDALFIETSAKDGSRIEEACKELARVLTSLENEEIEQSGLRLEKPEKEKKKRPCCPS
ncbi:uncharacterized protein LOC114537759 isoform X2 [Dendronephthya gigantea]|uniref:uncharacterized protein LOC114537759 isoform X2 n=1 Tax=Dendronephthya gigantea TaxID=151771 RepID=UPI00106CD133|nr:uncharacterized protein LOC114537759 isoform X2 [Dendronephthya gigantea]